MVVPELAALPVLRTTTESLVVAPAATGFVGPAMVATRSTGGWIIGVPSAALLFSVSPSDPFDNDAPPSVALPSQGPSWVGAVLVTVIEGREPPAGTA
ncbi:hypothetical protein, partial [uncultured Jatrophihabitans sp.]|uniref:hypothetical protein n=1 Tax=uncultured Jatrophihabitans sp. TaxID=1610747 RepID=UPI0035CB47D8